jgi:PAS domain S-box-containing protein
MQEYGETDSKSQIQPTEIVGDLPLEKPKATLVGMEAHLRTSINDHGERDERTRLALEAANLGTWDYEVATQLVHGSKNTSALYGLPDGEPTAPLDTLLEIVHPEDVNEVLSGIHLALDNGSDYAAEYRVCLPDGTTRWVSSKGRVITDESGRAIQIIGVASDITERMEIEQALLFSEQRLRFAIEGADIGTWHWDITADKLEWSDRSKSMFGLAPDSEVSYERYLSLLHPKDRARTHLALEEAINNKEDFTCEYRVVWPDKSVHWIFATGRGYYDSSNRPVRFEGIHQDGDKRRLADENLTSNYKREVIINQVGQAIRSSLDPNEIQRIAANALGENLKLDRGFFAMIDLARDRVDVGPDWHSPSLPSLAGPLRLSQFNVDVQELFGGGKTLIVSETGKGPWSLETVEVLASLGLKAIIVVPLHHNGDLVAGLIAGMHEPREWTSEEARLVESIAVMVRSTLESVRILQRERNIASILQEALQPKIPPACPGLSLAHFFQASLEESNVGGDFCDVFLLSETQTVLVIGDVSGKGLNAAAQVATVRNTLRTIIYLGQEIAECVSTLNQVFMQHDLINGFVTAFVGLFDSQAKTLIYTSCGHEPALLRRTKLGEIELLGPTGPILGMSETSVYEQMEVNLSENDTLLLYTDGVSESGPSRNQMLGTEGLSELFKNSHESNPRYMVAKIIAGVKVHAQYHLHDDACILLATCK